VIDAFDGKRRIRHATTPAVFPAILLAAAAGSGRLAFSRNAAV
jgi:hypothetical protein